MRKLIAIALISSSTLACLRADRALTTSETAAIRDSVTAALTALQVGMVTRQWDSVARMYADDSSFRWIENGTTVARSAAQIRKHFAELPPTTSFETTYDSVEITPLAPGVAFLTTRYSTTIKDSARGNFTFGGLLSITFVSRGGGWRMLNGHTSSVVPHGSE